MALAGVACGADWTTTGSYFNAVMENFTTTLSPNTAYELTFTVKQISFSGYDTDTVLTLGGSYHIMSQAGSYVGLSTTNNSLSNGSGDPGAVTSGTVDPDSLMHTITSASPVYGWVSLNKDKGSAAYGVSNMTITVAYDGTDSSIVLDFDGAQEYDTTINLTGQMIDPTVLALGSRITTVGNATMVVDGKTYLIPEPATATLSLLALAGLAARRRRK